MSDLALKLIEENKKSKVRFLDLGNCGIVGAVPEELGECIWLEELAICKEWSIWNGGEWISQKTKNSGPSNKITNLPSSISRLKYLKSLWVNGVKSEGLDLDDLSPISSLVSLEVLACSHTKIERLSELSGLMNLQKFFFKETQVKDLTILSGLKKLRMLSFSETSVSDLSPLASLTELQEIYCGETSVSDLSPLASLTELQVLACFKTGVIDLSPLASLTKLKEIYFGETKVDDLAPLAGLTELQKLYCGETKVDDLAPLAALTELRELSCFRTSVSNLSPLASLTKLQVLSFGETKVSDLAPLAGLIDLRELSCNESSVSDLSPLASLTKLRSLYLNSTNIDDISCINWHEFEQIVLVSIIKTRVSNLSPVLPLIKRGVEVKSNFFNKGICIKDCPLIEPPLEVVAQGNEAILRYFEEKNRQGEEKLYEAKIVVVGAGESGKTTLIKKLFNNEHPVPNLEDKRTQGIGIYSYTFKGVIANEIKQLQAHLWDFGGQELYHNTHQLFITEDTLYILLSDNRKNDTDFYYWLNIITLRAGDKCPILLVFNAKENAPRQIVPGEELFKSFNSLIKETVDVNFADTDFAPIYHMKSLIEKHFSCLQILGQSFPAYWVRIREVIAKLPYEYISWSQFASICEEHKISDIKQMRILAKTLHNLGVLLYFPEVFGLDDLIILQPQWCIDAIYGALDISEIDKNAGRFNEKTLADKWSTKRYSGRQLQLLKIMQHFDLCYAIEGTKDYIAPQLLPINERRDMTFPNRALVIYRFNYTFMPAGMLTRLIARLSIYIKAPYVWRTGVTLEWDEGTVAELIENQFLRQITIRVSGVARKRRLAEIRRNLHDIHKNFRGLKFEELVACNCSDCVESDAPTVFNLESLEDDANHNDEVKCTNGQRKKIPAKEILEGIEYTDKPRIFISYSHKNEELKNEFRKMISPLEREDSWKVWDDLWLLPGDNWNNEIVRHLTEANVIVLMLTSDFFDSNYIYDIEMSRALQRHESGEALLIGIIVDDCLWEETPLRRIQMLPKDAIPVEQHPNRSEVWKLVAQKIKETINFREGKQKRKGGWDEMKPRGKFIKDNPETKKRDRV